MCLQVLASLQVPVPFSALEKKYFFELIIKKNKKKLHSVSVYKTLQAFTSIYIGRVFLRAVFLRSHSE